MVYLLLGWKPQPCGRKYRPFAAKAVARAIADVEAWTEEDAAYGEYERTGEAIPLAAVEDWVRNWNTANELPPPAPCKSSS
jgi:hypothetical protein